MIRLAGLIAILGGAACALGGSLLPWFIGHDAVTAMGPADYTDLAVITGLGAAAALLGVGLMLGGRTLPLGIGALVVAIVAAVVITLPISDVSSRFSVTVSGDATTVLVAGPGPYASGMGILLWTVGAIAALVAAPVRRKVASPQPLPPSPAAGSSL